MDGCYVRTLDCDGKPGIIVNLNRATAIDNDGSVAYFDLYTCSGAYDIVEADRDKALRFALNGGESMSKEWTVVASFTIQTSVRRNTEKEARDAAKKELHELASYIRPLCDCLDIELDDVYCEEEDYDE